VAAANAFFQKKTSAAHPCSQDGHAEHGRLFFGAAADVVFVFSCCLFQMPDKWAPQSNKKVIKSVIANTIIKALSSSQSNHFPMPSNL